MTALKTMLVFATALLTAGCSNSPSTEQIEFVTWGQGLPKDAKIVAWKESGFTQDPKEFLIFDTTSAGCAEFAQKYSDGATLDELLTSRTEIKGARSTGTYADRIPDIPWDLTTISNGRFFQREQTTGFLSIDIDKNRVYLFR